MKKNVYVMAMLLLPLFSIAQKDSTAVERTNTLTAGLNYQTKLHYFGRTDSLKSSGLFPTIGFELKNGLYANGNFVFVRNAAEPLSYTGTSIEAGYRFPESKNFEGNVFVSKFLYKDQSALVQSALKAQTGINLTYKNKILNLNGGADLKFSDRTDVGVTAGVDHLFIFPLKGIEKSALAFMPSLTANAGTQNFTQTYLKKDNVLGIPVTQQTTEQVQQFNILSYEFSAPVVFVAGKFNASVIPSYVIPQNLINIQSRPDLSERGEKMFYVTFGIGFRL